jgi:hypothetical protein
VTLPTEFATFFRTEWAKRFKDSCVVKRESSATFDATTSGTYSVTYSTQYSGVCLVRPKMQGDEQAGERQAEIRMYSVFVPYDETDPLPDDLVDITSTNDSFLNGKQFVVRNVYGDTYMHRRELVCEEVVDG